MEGLLGQPLRQVKSGYLFSYLGSVFYTVGTVSDFKYFLPRILELAAGEDAFHVEIVFKKLRMAEWDNGLKEEVASIEAFVEAWFLQAVAAAEDTLDVWPLDGLICGIALAGFDLEPYFQCLLAHPLVLMAWYEMNPDVQDGVLSNSFWDGSEAQMQPVLDFMASPAVQALIK